MKWERIEETTYGTCHDEYEHIQVIERSRVADGWLVRVVDDSDAIIALTFVPDSQQIWKVETVAE